MRREVAPVFDDRSQAWFGDSMSISKEEMLSRVWRFDELTPSPRAFLDCTLPGHIRTLYSALGHGADDEQLEGTAVEAAENYHIDFIKAEPDNGAALHSHGSEETFVAIAGHWDVFWGNEGEESVTLSPLDGMIVPAGVMRGFRNTGTERGVLMAILGAHNAGHCVWARTLQEPFARITE
ncbi:MAG: cupin domain-containing protein [Gammaproteobacteria bacterium]|nr:cupin domain-containing protein [Gammaproteobacteria bacterium]